MKMSIYEMWAYVKNSREPARKPISGSLQPQSLIPLGVLLLLRDDGTASTRRITSLFRTVVNRPCAACRCATGSQLQRADTPNRS